MDRKYLQSTAIVALVFFSWTFGGLFDVAYAVKSSDQLSAISGQQKNNSSKQKTKDSSRQSAFSNQQTNKKQKTEEKLQRAIEEIVQIVEKVKTVQTDQERENEKKKLKTKKTEIEGYDIEIKKEFAETEKKLKDSKLPDEILQRHYKFVKNYEDNLKELKANLNDIDKAKGKAEVEAKAEKTRKHLEKVKPPKRHQPLDPNKLPHRSPEVKKREPRTKTEEFSSQETIAGKGTVPDLRTERRGVVESGLSPKHRSHDARRSTHNAPILLAANGPITGLFDSSVTNTQSPAPVLLAAATLPSPSDLAETIEVQFTPEIQAKATELNNNPVKIYNWVRNNIEYVPTYGSIQGANMCLQTKQCNDFDTSSLLIALLRASNIPAKYVYGTIELPIEKVMNWVGGFTDANAALELISSGGIPVKGITMGGKFASVRMEHVWVEAYLPYGNYRGTMRDNSGKAWIPMDGSFKQYTYASGFDMTATVPFDQNVYLAQVRSENPVHYYQNQIQTYLDANMPDKTLIDVKGSKEMLEENLGILASTLPYKSIAILGRYSDVPDNLRASVGFTFYDPIGFSEVSYSISAPELAGKRITISYTPASASDEGLINSYNGYMYDVPAYLLHLKPVLKIDGSIKLTGESTTMGSDQMMSLSLSSTGITTETIQKNLTAGTYYAVGINSQGINEDALGNRNYGVITNLTTKTADMLSNDDLIGEHLYVLALTFFMANDKMNKASSKIYNIAQQRILSEGITSYKLSVSYVFGLPKQVSPSGIEIDVAMDKIIAISKEGNVGKEKAYMEITGLTSSYHEHDIFERIEGFASISSVRALQTANVNGIPIYQINQGNIAQILPQLQVMPDIVTRIQDAVNAGKEVTISRTDVQVNDWTGIGYIVRDPARGSGAYMISGGLAGGGTTRKVDGMQVVQIYKGAYGWLKDNLDTLIRRNIITAATLEIGEETVATAAEKMEEKISYTKIGRCTGLVISSYKAAGIDLRKIAKDAGRGDPGNVSEMYLLIRNKSEFWIGTGEPILGDILFFKNTYTRPNSMKRSGDDDVTHVGIVSEVENAKVIGMMHAAGTKKGIVEAEFPEGVTSNSYWGPKLLGVGRPR